FVFCDHATIDVFAAARTSSFRELTKTWSEATTASAWLPRRASAPNTARTQEARRRPEPDVRIAATSSAHRRHVHVDVSRATIHGLANEVRSVQRVREERVAVPRERLHELTGATRE